MGIVVSLVSLVQVNDNTQKHLFERVVIPEYQFGDFIPVEPKIIWTALAMYTRRNVFVLKLDNLHLVGTKVAVATTETFVVRYLDWSATGAGLSNAVGRGEKVGDS